MVNFGLDQMTEVVNGHQELDQEQFTIHLDCTISTLDSTIISTLLLRYFSSYFHFKSEMLFSFATDMFTDAYTFD